MEGVTKVKKIINGVTVFGAFVALGLSMSAKAETLNCDNERVTLEITGQGADFNFVLSTQDYVLKMSDIPDPAPESLPKIYTLTGSVHCEVNVNDPFLRVCTNNPLQDQDKMTLSGAPDGRPHTYSAIIKFYMNEFTRKTLSGDMSYLTVQIELHG